MTEVPYPNNPNQSGDCDMNERLWYAMPESIQHAIEESLVQADNAKTVSYEEVKKRFDKWFLS